jgi:hypothetical protein
MTVEVISPSLLKNRSFSHPRAIPMSRNAVPHVDSHGKKNRALTIPREATPAISHNAKCIPLRVLAVGKRPKFRLNPEKADRYIAANATVL